MKQKYLVIVFGSAICYTSVSFCLSHLL